MGYVSTRFLFEDFVEGGLIKSISFFCSHSSEDAFLLPEIYHVWERRLHMEFNTLESWVLRARWALKHALRSSVPEEADEVVHEDR